MSWVAVAVVGGSLISGAMSADASKSAASTQAGAADRASANTMAMFNTQQNNLAPWMQSGQLGNQALMQWLGIGLTPGTQTGHYQGGDDTPGHTWVNDPLGPGALTMNPNAPGLQQYNPTMFAQDPSYQFQLDQGQKALMNNMSATGGTYSGNTLKALDQYSQGLASTGYQNALNNYNTWQNSVYQKLSGVSNTGANTAGNIAGLGMNAAGSVSNNMIGAGNGMAAGQVGSANALTGGINSGINNYMMYRAMQTPQSTGGTGGGYPDTSMGYYNIDPNAGLYAGGTGFGAGY